jgi:uncharacterized protein YjiS (DUF1127 family)
MRSITSHAAPAAISSPARGFAGRLTGWARQLLALGERRAAIKELHKLDDRELRDLGLTRDQIEAAVGGFARAEAGLVELRVAGASGQLQMR